MARNTSGTVLFIVLTLLVQSAFSTVPPALKTLPGHVPKLPPGLTAFSDVPATNEIQLAIGLPLRDAAGLEQFLTELYDPASTNYHRYVTPEEFTDRFGPTATDYNAVSDFAATNGLQMTATHGNRLLLDVRGKAGDVERALHIKLLQYHHPTENRDFYAPDADPQVDANLPVADISGLSTYVLPRPKVHKMDSTQTGSAQPRTGSGPGGAYKGKDFRAAYVPGTTLTGAGQTVGLLQFDGFYQKDITAYETAAGLPNVPIQTVLLDGYNGVPTSNGNIEVSLDIEMTIAIAPGLSKVIVFEAGPNGLPNDILNSMVASNQVKQLSSSWGWGGGPSTTTDNIFKQMAAQGQSFFNASGDSDAFTSGSRSVNGVDNPSVANAPSSSPYITMVGGTTLTTTGPGGAWVSEQVWNWGLTSGSYVGSSGGISSYYSLPSWQSGVSMTPNGGSTTKRNIPDVALTADNVWITYGNGSSEAVGGTSCASPLWAGLTALINQQAAAVGNAPVGFLNPAIYTLGKGANFNTDFHDITVGNNEWSSSPSAFVAVTGYDLCTGWGTPAGIGLINALAGVTSVAPRFQTVVTTGKDFQASLVTTPGLVYQVQCNSNLFSINWVNLGSSFTATGTVSTVTDSGALGVYPRRFYRAKVVQ